MARLSINEMTTYRWSFEQDVMNYRAAGIPAIGVWRHKLSDYGEEKGVELLAESGLQVSNLLWAGGFTGSEGRNFRESIDDGADALRLAAAMHSPCVVVYTGTRAGHTHNHARRLVIDALKELGGLASKLGVVLALEPMHPGCACDCTFLTSLDDALNLMAAVNGQSIKLAFDTYHLGSEPGVVDRLAELAEKIAIVHLGDGKGLPDGEQNRNRLGEGNLPLADIVRGLTAAGYNGYFDVELIGEEIEASDYDELLRHSRAAFERICRS